MISFIIPMYNSEKSILRCIKSIVDLKVVDSEIIVVDDGSKDNGYEVVKDYADKHDAVNLKLIKKENGGAASARNHGINLSNKEYIQFVDADDYLDPNYYDYLKEYLISGKYDIIYFNYNKIRENGKIEYSSTSNYFVENGKEDFIMSACSPCLSVIKRDLIQQINFSFKENIIYEDYASMAYIACASKKTKYVNEAIYNYQMSTESVMRTADKSFKKKYLDIITASENLRPLLQTNYSDEIEMLITKHLLVSGNLRLEMLVDNRTIIKNAHKKINDCYRQIIGKRIFKNRYFKKLSMKDKIKIMLCYYEFSSFFSLIWSLKR